MNVTVTLSVRPYTDEPHTTVNSPWSVLEAHEVDAESAGDTVTDLAASLAGDARIGDAVALVTVTDAQNRLVTPSRAWLIEGGTMRELYTSTIARGADVTPSETARKFPAHILWSLGENLSGFQLLWIIGRFAQDIEKDLQSVTSRELRDEGRAVLADLWRERVMLRGRLDNLVCLGGGARMRLVNGVPVVVDTTEPGGPVDLLARLVHARMRACACLPRPAGIENDAAPCACLPPIPEALADGPARNMRGVGAVFSGGTDPVESVGPGMDAAWSAIEENASQKITTLAVAARGRARVTIRSIRYTVLVRILAFRFSAERHAESLR